MRAVVVLAHPDPASYSHAIAAEVVGALTAGGHTVVLHDLYAEGFTAAMSAAERNAYHGDEPVLDPLVRAHIADLATADTLIFVYPTWWSTVPAILKGWLERVMVPGVGFVFDADHRVRPGLTHIRRLVGISTYGSARWYVRLINDNGRRTINRALRISTGWHTRTRWLGLYAMDASTAPERAAFLARITHDLARL
ncbi:MAG: putative oxidoreductase [Ilumatobacteraceae bacterium]|nr:putative oxidoreductase [Ilumatobacteraceae bacterium]